MFLYRDSLKNDLEGSRVIPDLSVTKEPELTNDVDNYYSWTFSQHVPLLELQQGKELHNLLITHSQIVVLLSTRLLVQ